MSIFQKRSEQIAQSERILSPSAQSGWMVATSEVVSKELESNPYMYALNNMSTIDGKILLDQVKDGLSIVRKDLSPSRQENIVVNPKWVNHYTIGGETQKSGNLNVEPGSIAIGDVIMSGDNNSIPSIIGMQIIPKNLSNTTQTTPQDINNNTSATDSMSLPGNIPVDPFSDATVQGSDIGYGSQNEGRNIGTGRTSSITDFDVTGNLRPPSLPRPISGTNIFDQVQGYISDIVANKEWPPEIDAKTGKPYAYPNYNGRGPYGNPILTGTLLITRSEMEGYING